MTTTSLCSNNAQYADYIAVDRGKNSKNVGMLSEMHSKVVCPYESLLTWHLLTWHFLSSVLSLFY